MGGRGGAPMRAQGNIPASTPVAAPAPPAPVVTPPLAPLVVPSGADRLDRIRGQLEKLRATKDGHALIQDLTLSELKELAAKVGTSGRTKAELRQEIIFQTIAAPGQFHRARYGDTSTFRRG